MPLTAKIEYLLETMQDGLYLILLDNLEDNLAEDGNIAEEGLRLFVERCLTQPSGARLIVTSREQVKIAAAALHSTRSIPLREGLPEDEAVALLRDLDPQGTLGLRDAPEEDLRRAARLTRGIPRALEILTGILHEDPTASLSRLLADENLFGEQVVEQLVATGYSRLGEAERHVIEALAVFDRPVEETSVAYLLHPWWPGLDVRARLHRLVRGYFVSVNRVTGRYSLHPLDRDYAYRQIPDVPDEEPDSYNRRNLELRAAAFYARLRKPESEWHTVDDLEPQLVEFEHRVRAGDYDDACRVLNPIDFDYLYLWGHYALLVEMREKLLGRLINTSLQTANLTNLGNAYYSLGQFERALGYYEQALSVDRETGDRRGEGVRLGNLGNAYHALGQVERAIKLYAEALVTAREIGDRRNEGVWHRHLGNAYLDFGQVKRAIECHEQALAISRQIDDRRGEGAELGNLGRAYRVLGQLERAVNLYEEALVIAREIGDRQREDVCLANMGIAYLVLGQVEQAIEFHEEALAIARDIGDRRSEGAWLGHLGWAYRALGHLERAINLCEEALAIARDIGDRRRESVWLGNLGDAHRALGQSEQAINLCEEALAIACEIGDRRVERYRLLELSKALLSTGELAKARHRYVRALALDVPETSHQADLGLGIVLLRQGGAVAGETFADAVTHCRAMLDKTPSLYAPRYALAAALVGQAVCDPRWAEESGHAELLTPALAEYRRALEITSAPGIVQDALRDLELIRAAGIEGLKPVFELLENAEYEPDLPKDLAEILEDLT
jgi:tetratricopeptide (TPR) repeat protein